MLLSLFVFGIMRAKPYLIAHVSQTLYHSGFQELMIPGLPLVKMVKAYQDRGEDLCKKSLSPELPPENILFPAS
jgi:hypothetical protein